MSKTNIIVIVPIKNESWILKDFIACARRWADIIIIGDNRSTDESVSIARSFDCSVMDLGPTFDEANRRKRLIDEARKIPGKRLIFSIDADEMLSANWADSPEWRQMLDAAPGTRFCFDWVQTLPGLERCVMHGSGMDAAFVDDGTEYQGVAMHSPRTPATKGKSIKCGEIKLLHYIWIDPDRTLSKHRWYKCLEHIEHNKRPWEICVRYQDTQLKTYGAPVIPLKDEWLRGYGWLDEYRARSKDSEKWYWWDGEVLNFFDKCGVEKFRKLNIWDVDWNQKALMWGRQGGSYNDPRSVSEKFIHSFIQKHREQLNLKRQLPFKLIGKFARIMLPLSGW